MSLNTPILLSSNSRVLSTILSKSLSTVGYTSVVEAKDGLDAKRLCTTAEFDILFIDWAMTELSAEEFIREVRELPQYSNTPILIATLPSDIGETVEVCKDETISTIPKPFSPQGLKSSIEALCPSTEIENSTAKTEAEIHEDIMSCITESARRTFETMAFTKIECKEPKLLIDPEGPPAWYSCTIGINGASGSKVPELRGNVSLIFGERIAETLLRSMMMISEDDEIELEQVLDAVGELTNMTVGGGKAEAQTEGIDYCISLPSVVVGENHHVAANENTVIYVIEMKTDAGDLSMHLMFE